jgi:phage-related protein
MAGSRTLKLSILGDVDNLNKSLKAATADVDTFGDKMTKAGKVVGAALAAAAAAAGAYAIKIGVEGVKAAIADEKAQTQLALALENATGATKGAIAATEQFILQTSLATGVADDELRPALGRLARSTGDVTAAQDLLKTALDVATATGKPLEAVAQALGKAYDGNTTSLGRLGIGLSSAELKTMSFTDVQGKLTDLFGGAAAANADTYSGRIARMQIAFDEAKETIGFALLPILEKLMKFINQIALPAINAMSSGFGLDKGGIGGAITTLGNIIINTFTPIINGLVKAFGYVKNAIGDNLDTFKEFGGYIGQYLAPVIGTVLGGALQAVGKIASGVIDIIAGVVKVINGLIGGAIDGINAVIRAYNAIPLLPNVPTISKPSIPTSTVSSSSVPSITLPNIPSVSTPSISGASKGTSSAASSGAKASTGYASPTMNYNPLTGQASTTAYNPLSGMTVAPTINIGVAGDPEGVARTVIDVLNRSYGRGALGAAALTT